ncbi:FAD-binding oxidoreductase [Paracoccus sp. p3-h83]|uniref:FAD-binding oxidoreductase n=1 Tax=Paracoccus sp. p3-h83 TaxID=3342805 RepID=UPI0035B788EC
MLNPADTAFVATLPDGLIRPAEPRDLDEPRGRHLGQGAFVACPRNVQDAAAITRACAAAQVAILPRGGGTGLVAGSVMPTGPAPLIVSFERMRAIRASHPRENTLIAEAGVTLTEIRTAAEDAGRMFPLALASQGSAQLGGLLSTNAGGVNVLRWGNTRDLVLGIEAVLPDGSILNGLKRLRKDNTGYDLRHLLIGAEGTLGLITAASLRLVTPPAETATALMVVRDPSAALELLALADVHAGGCISAFELISGQGLAFLAEADIPHNPPFAATPPWMALIELGLPKGSPATAILEAIFADAAEAGLADDGIIAQSDTQRAALWHLREDIPAANRKIGAIASHDIALPLSDLPDFIAAATARLTEGRDLRINCFGHLGDGNLHFNLFPAPGRNRAEYDPIRAELTGIVHQMVLERGGSISAEHGIGRLKAAELAASADPTRLAAMRAIKQALDPSGIMNPGAVLSI